MKNPLPIFVISCLLLVACSSSRKTSDSGSLTTTELLTSSDISGLVKVTGGLNYSGSEPFVTPTIFVNDDTSYKLRGDSTFINEIYPDINGEQATLYGKVIEQGNLIYFEVHFYEINKD